MRLFLYGTLQPAAGTAMADWLRPRIVEAEPASVAGRLIAVPDPRGWYPALLPGAARCRGTLVRAELSRADVARLDRYEGTDYRRTTLRARAAGRMVTCSGYVWRSALPAGAVWMAGGDFLWWLAHERRRAFGSSSGHCLV
ncbi:gamma-glutamylcyclotransferase (GGCT)/AIG2-like uncharacterized protein YtfP [Novosphingobium chloroacetimidivorans]|uniref:Gamma-glutamylcyclotransferase (GGCT)/AIG2-like uncharacterized protein YtfP n=1 Tax=Novosphingobium chloroacetimidivorans TaxID=1428314 RepID=A0A7W7K7V1_9SPHN|nr:gamma-glutamylcyclotransferase family protein [Novosphingobium chloroacetimidivorans]MBB4857801.1 gamma-glutamylcyclotransferase (GGCT)/AIG2-like uncharacterized protein YtfP [Novosphingobium chloroacetimidivorans]